MAAVHDAVSHWGTGRGFLSGFVCSVSKATCAAHLDVQENNLRAKEDLSCQSPASSTPVHAATPKAVSAAGVGAGGEPGVGASGCGTETQLSTIFPCTPAV